MFEHQRGRHGTPGDHNHNHGPQRPERGRRRDLRGEIGRELREELRRNLRRGAGQHQVNLGDLFGRGRPGGGPAIRRGEIRPLILDALRQKPMHGYEVIQWLEEQSEGRWRPSAGSVYPTLQQLADEGLVTSDEVDGRRTYTLTDAGTKAAAEQSLRSPWARRDSRGRGASEGNDDRQPDVRQLAMQLAAAVIQVHKMGSPAARREAVKILTDARKQMYRLLSEDDVEPGEEAGNDGTSDAPNGEANDARPR